MKGKVVLTVNDDSTYSIQSSMPVDVRIQMPADYTFSDLNKFFECAQAEVKKIREFDPFAKPLSIHV